MWYIKLFYLLCYRRRQAEQSKIMVDNVKGKKSEPQHLLSMWFHRRWRRCFSLLTVTWLTWLLWAVQDDQRRLRSWWRVLRRFSVATRHAAAAAAAAATDRCGGNVTRCRRHVSRDAATCRQRFVQVQVSGLIVDRSLMLTSRYLSTEYIYQQTNINSCINKNVI